LGIEEKEPFGLFHGRKIGLKGRLSKPLTIEAAAARASFMNRPATGIFPFGKKENSTCAVVSGGAAFDAFQAIEEGVDLYVSGEYSHSVYHHALEGRLNVIAGGHYSTEVWGVRKLMEECRGQMHLPSGEAPPIEVETEFIDVPTGL
jgi:putative NIF3 family GTP cyclohydrolase 1 type 2